MKTDLSDYSSESLLKMFIDKENPDKDLSYHAGQELLQRWRKGSDLELLIALLESEKTGDRTLGAFFLREIGGRIDGLKEPATKLADDSLHDCRWAFVYFMLGSDFYDETIATGLAKCLLDFNLVVRRYVIQWAVSTSDERFEHFCRSVESGANAVKYRLLKPVSIEFWKDSHRRRALRGLTIARRLRAGDTIDQIRKDTPEEDNLIFDSLQFSEDILKRYVARRKADPA